MSPRAWTLAAAAWAGLCGCAASGGGWWQGSAAPAPLGEAGAGTVARDLAAVLAEEWPPAWTVVRVSQGAVSGRLEEALRESGYAIAASDAEKALDVRATIEAVRDSELLCAGMAAGREWRVDRLYGRDAEGRLQPMGGYTIRAQRGEARRVAARRYAVEPEGEEAPGDDWPLPTPGDAQVAAEKAPLGADDVSVVGLEAAAPAAAVPAWRLDMRRGSLRANAERLLEGFGYRVGAWPGNGTHHWDAVLEKGFTLEVRDVRGVLDLLRGYGVAARVRESERTVDFEEWR